MLDFYLLSGFVPDYWIFLKAIIRPPFIFLKRYYIASARELVRINGTTKAPVMNYAAESMLGAVTIRAFSMVERFVHTNMRLIDTDASLFFHTNAALEWVLLRVEALQILLIIASAVFLILLPEGVISAGISLTPHSFNFVHYFSHMEQEPDKTTVLYSCNLNDISYMPITDKN